MTFPIRHVTDYGKQTMIDEQVGEYAVQVIETLTGVEIKVSKKAEVQYFYADFYPKEKADDD